MKPATAKKNDSRSSQKSTRLEATTDRAAASAAKKAALEALAKRAATVEAKKASGGKKAATTAAKKPATKAAAKKPVATVEKKPAAKAAAKKPAAKAAAKKAAAAEATKPAEAVATPESADERTLEDASEEGAAPANVEVPPPRPSERLLAARADGPTERALTDEERDAMAKVSETARRYVGAEGEPHEIVKTIAAFVEEVRTGKREEPTNQDVRLGLGVLWGEQVRAEVGWSWVHLTYPDGFASYAVVPEDRAFACFPLNRIPDAFRAAGPNTSAHVFESIRDGSLPARKPNAYLVIG